MILESLNQWLLQMDIVGNLPPEINDIILRFLSGSDLWSCLSVSKTWRIMTNTNRLWIKHCKHFGINTCDLCADDRSLKCEFSLCSLASEWKRCRDTIVKWKNKEFKSVDLHSLSRLQFYSNNDNLVMIDDMQVVTVIGLRDNGLTFFQFSLPPGIEFSEDGNVLINGDHIIIICNNIGIVYKKDQCYNLHSVFTYTENFSIQISPINFLKNYDNRVLCEFSFLSHNKFWGSYQIDNHFKHHVLLDIVTNEITVINPPLDTEVVEVIGVNHRIIFESLHEVLIYDNDGRVLFKRNVGEFCCASANDQVVAVFKPSSIVIFNILTGFKLCHLLNQCYQPHLFVGPNKSIIFLTRREVKYDVIFSFSACTGKRLWSFKVPIPYSHYAEKTFVDIYGTLLVLYFDGGVKYKTRIFMLDIESGFVVYEDSCADLHFLSQNCFVKDLNPVKLFFV